MNSASYSSYSASICCRLVLSIFLLLILDWGLQNCDGFGTFGFDIHHRFSDPVKGILSVDELPEQGGLDYYVAMAHRDRIIHGRRLATTTTRNQTLLTFYNSNMTYRISSLGYLHYANVSVGTPSLSFLVALDTGSDLFWLPCDCSSCVHTLLTTSGKEIDLNIYSPNTSSTSMKVACNSTICARQSRCSAENSNCPYQVSYLSENTSTTGILVEDVLHLVTDESNPKVVDARITFGCGQDQRGSFLDGAAPNGLFGLGVDNMSVPSILASKGLSANSFSMCFGPEGIGRINFGDKGSSDQGETPINFNRKLHPTYNISMTRISVGEKAADLDLFAIFDSGTSFTYLSDPAYTLISESFNSQAQNKRHQSDSSIPFEYCYDISSNQTSFAIPTLNLTMKGDDMFYVTDPIVLISYQSGRTVYCLGVIKSGDVNIIGQNFMTGYHIVFDREKMILGWKPSNCYDTKGTSLLPISPSSSRAVPPATAVDPEATSGGGSSSNSSGASPPFTSLSLCLYLFTWLFLAMVYPLPHLVLF